jgi:hypothetical protein
MSKVVFSRGNEDREKIDIDRKDEGIYFPTGQKNGDHG